MWLEKHRMLDHILGVNIIFGIDRKVTKDIAQFVNYIESMKSHGDNVVLDVLTNEGTRGPVTVKLGER